MPKSISCLCATLVVSVVLSAQSANAMERGRFRFGEGSGIGIGEQFSFVPSFGFVIRAPSVYDPHAPYYYPHYNPDPPYPYISPNYSTTPNVRSAPGSQPSWYYCDEPRGYYRFAQTCDHVWLSFRMMAPSAPGS